MQDGYHQERFDSITREESSYSYEDLPSDLFGADFAVNYFDPSSDKTLAEQITDYFDAKLKPTDPQNAPNYDNLPGSHNDLEGSPPSAQNETTVPMYISPDENGTD
jgi:filamentous hemagglutinin